MKRVILSVVVAVVFAAILLDSGGVGLRAGLGEGGAGEIAEARRVGDGEA